MKITFDVISMLCTDKIDTSMHLHFCETFCYEHGMTNQKNSSCYVIYIFI